MEFPFYILSEVDTISGQFGAFTSNDRQSVGYDYS